MRTVSLATFRCPDCLGTLDLRPNSGDSGQVESGSLLCASCGKTYPILDGRPQFIQTDELSGSNRSFAGFYDWYSILYRPMSVMASALFGGESRMRREMLDSLTAPSGKFLDVGSGSGRNLPFIMRELRPDMLHGVDISNRQLESCARSASSNNWPVELAAAMAEALPYADESFDTVLHVGGINFFSDPAKAISEMVRVARPGAQILIADETEKAARLFDWLVPGFSKAFGGKRAKVVPPVAVLPPGIENVQLQTILRGMAYRIQFRKSRASVE